MESINFFFQIIFICKHLSCDSEIKSSSLLKAHYSSLLFINSFADIQGSLGLNYVLKKSEDDSMLINIQSQDVWRNNVLFLIPTMVSIHLAV